MQTKFETLPHTHTSASGNSSQNKPIQGGGAVPWPFSFSSPTLQISVLPEQPALCTAPEERRRKDHQITWAPEKTEDKIFKGSAFRKVKIFLL